MSETTRRRDRRPEPTYFRPWRLWRATVVLANGHRQNVAAPTRDGAEALIAKVGDGS